MNSQQICERFFLIEEYIKGNYQDNSISLSLLSAMYSTSEASISRAFMKYRGVSYLAYINSLRIACSIKYMQASDFSLSEIAKLSGFPSVLTMRRVFKKYVGITPGIYRTLSADDRLPINLYQYTPDS